MNIDICKKCLSCDDILVDTYELGGRQFVTISVLSDKSLDLYRTECSFDFVGPNFFETNEIPIEYNKGCKCYVEQILKENCL